MPDLSNLSIRYFQVLIAIAILFILYGFIFNISEFYYSSIGIILAVIVFAYLKIRFSKE